MCQTPQNAQNSEKCLKKAIRIVNYTRTKIQLGTGDTGDTILPLSFIPLSPSLQFKNFRPFLELGTPFCPYNKPSNIRVSRPPQLQTVALAGTRPGTHKKIIFKWLRALVARMCGRAELVRASPCTFSACRF